MGPVNSLQSFTIKGITFPLAKGTPVNGKILEAILYSYAPYYSGTGPNGTDPQTYAGSGNGLQPAWGGEWSSQTNIGKIISALMPRLYLAKNEWDIEREARFAVNDLMRQLTGSNSALDVATASRLGDNRFIGLFAESVMRNIAENNAIKAALLQASKPNSKRGAPPPSNFLKNTTKTTGVKQQASPGKSTPNKNPAIPALPKPPPASGCVPGYYIYFRPEPTFNSNSPYPPVKVPTCVPCPADPKKYVKGSGC